MSSSSSENPHRSAIETLARETGSQLEHVQMLFEREYECLEATARVHAFLAVIAFHNVKRQLRAHPCARN
jgi:Protein of unknown function (DUF3562)